MVITVVFAVVFIILGILFLNNKFLGLISGYNTLPKEEKEKFDEKALCKFMAYLMFAIAGDLAIIALGALLKINLLVIIASIVMSVISIGTVIYCNTGNRFKKN